MIIFDSTKSRVKSIIRRHVFGQGISLCDVRQPYSAADLDWAQEALNAAAADFVVVGTDSLPDDAELDRLASESAAIDAMSQFGAIKPGGCYRDATEEAAIRYNLSPEAEAERDADWAAYQEYQDRMSVWVNRNLPGPQPY